MGLDMYLTKRTYVRNWEHMSPEELHKITIKRGGKIRKDIEPKRISYIIENIGYWRKANAIHRWFVDNVQDGNDDCKEYYVPKEKLERLLSVVNKVLSSSELIDGEIENGYTFEKAEEEGLPLKRVPIIEKGKLIKDSTLANKLLPTQEGFFFGMTNYDQWYYEDLQLTKEILEKALKEDGSFYYQSSW